MGPERHGFPARHESSHMEDFIQNRNHIGVKTGVKNAVASQVAVDLIRSDPVYQAGSSGTSHTPSSARSFFFHWAGNSISVTSSSACVSVCGTGREREIV